MNQTIQIQALKYPNIPHYEWEGELVKQTSEYIIVLCKQGRKLKHYTRNQTFIMDNTSIEVFSLKEGFTAAMEIEGKQITSYYCNVALPSEFENNQIRFIDLDLDLIKKRQGDWQVVDEDEFEENSVKYHYTPELKKRALLELEELKRKVADKEFPFNSGVIKLLSTV
ncbi:DUF402 domain-containing protein [Bacillus sp. SD088]|uniref:DUF402 domain-containing protein n=1 Tax=Bacillus sp. SD088 TaxID=2782012 RepID=UPI001A97CE93|nr:DUF402 domain-containing protein [Bacillus sp. SD088]MBO0992461.1 DUF402 domain-containing protein [Bacillus sp. SD088]